LLNVIMLNVVRLNVVAPLMAITIKDKTFITKLPCWMSQFSHFDECRYAECRGAKTRD
jgi:hypothetical protein